jgi:hypothetical protein
MKWVFILSIFVYAVPGGSDPRVFDSIEFSGLKFLSKQTIAVKSGITAAEGKKLAADTEKIKGYLSKEPLVATYKLIDKKNVLTIIVREREPRYVVAVKKAKGLILFEVDASFVPFSAEIHRQDVPLVIVSQGDLDGAHFSRNAVKVFELLERIRAVPLWSEIQSVELRDDGLLDIQLKLRPTVFTVTSEDSEFKRLAAAAGWCDTTGRYPARMYVRSDFTVIR